ncbi:MAG: hypothetical protein D6733_04885 [Methanobacteriota archaeon]|nr:MAG: hypothetical protein D6733_04885 [Euryarchaeota archaeon]
MEGDETAFILIRVIAIFLILVGVLGTVSGIYGLVLVKNYGGAGFSTAQASESILDAALLLTRDKNTLQGSLEEAGKSVGSASEKTSKASAELAAGAGSIKDSSEADKEAADELRAAADAMDTLWGPTNVAVKLRAAADKMEESALKREAASAALQSSSEELREVSASLNETGSDIMDASSSVGSMISRVTENLNDLVEWLQKLDVKGTKTILYEIVLYLIVIHMLFAGVGVALLLIDANLYR